MNDAEQPTIAQLLKQMHAAFDEALSQRNEARKERDEARREACLRVAENLALLGSNAPLGILKDEHAARRGWDCFKETP